MHWGLKLALSALRRHWLQSLLLLLGLALGTAMVIAVDLANQSASREFERSRETLTGKASHRVLGVGLDAGGLTDAAYRRLRSWPGFGPMAPVLDDMVQVSQWQNRPLRLLGVDPLAEAPFRSYFSSLSGKDDATLVDLVGRSDSILVPAALAAELPPNRRLQLRYGGRVTEVRVIGVLQSEDPLLNASLANVLLADLGTAQRVLGLPGRLSRIDLSLSPVQAKLLQSRLPQGLSLASSQDQDDALARMSRAFKLNLSALSLLALVVGMFLVYNTVSFSVLRRRRQFGILRTLGVTRREIAVLVLAEALLLGLIGSALGVGLGILLGQGLLKLVVQTINDLYYPLETTRLTLEPLSLFKGICGALGAALLATILPAREAMMTPPAGVLRASSLEDQFQPLLGRLAAYGLALILLGAGLQALPLSLWFSFGGFTLLIAGTALGIPLLAHWTMQGLAHALPPLWRLAPISLARSLSRSAVAIAALMVAISVVISVSLMINSFRHSVVAWLDQSLSADLYVARPGQQGQLPADLREQVAREAGVGRVESARLRTLQAKQGFIKVLALSGDISSRRPYIWHDGPRETIWQRLGQNGVLVSEPYATHHGIAARSGQTLSLPTDSGPQKFQILGIYRDYSSDQGVVLLPASVYQHYWHDPYISSLSIFARPGSDLEALAARLRQSYAGRYQVEVQSHQALKQGAMTVFDRTFAITSALRLLAIVVAFMGVFSTLMSLLLERRRSFGLLRALGFGRGQLAALILLESGLMGLFAGILALPLGMVLALCLIYGINLRSFGWSMDLHPDPLLFGQGLLLALGAALLAGLWPAWRCAFAPPAESIRWE